MADLITVRIPATGAPVVTGGSVNPGGDVIFKNEAATTATINFGNKTPLCSTGLIFKVTKQSAETACSNYLASGTYPFTTRVGAAQAQTGKLIVLAAPNPIIFPEKKPIIFPEDWVALALGIGIGLLVGLWLGRRFFVRAPQR